MNYSLPNVDDLQSFLSDAQHDEIDKVRRQQLIKEQFQTVNEFIGGHITAWIPYTTLEWIFIIECFALVKYLTPCHLFAIRTCYIVNWNVERSAKR